MAYDRNSDKKPTYAAGEFTGEGNMVDDPKEIGSGDNTFISFKVAFNSRNFKEYEGSLFVNCTASGLTADRILADGHKGKQILVTGDLIVDEPWENKDGDLMPSFSLKVRRVGESWKWPEKNSNGSGGSRRSRDDRDEDEPRGRSGRSSRSSRDEDEPRGGRTRRSRGAVSDEGDSVDD